MNNLWKEGFYPRYCFHRAPTADSWCLLTAAQIHGLTQQADFAVESFFFYKNLPIKWVRIVGVVVAIDEFFGRRVYTIDDSSGVCIEAIVDTPGAFKNTVKGAAALEAHVSEQLKAHQDEATASNKVYTAPVEDLYAHIDVGDVLDVKGSLSTFRDDVQVKVTKIKVLRGTALELELWDRRARFCAQVLNQPWVLSETEITESRKRAERFEKEEKRRKEKEKKNRPEKTVEEVRAAYSKPSLASRVAESTRDADKKGDEISKETAETRSKYNRKGSLRSTRPIKAEDTTTQDTENDQELMKIRAKYRSTYHGSRRTETKERSLEYAEDEARRGDSSDKLSRPSSTRLHQNSSRGDESGTAQDMDEKVARMRYMRKSTLAKSRLSRSSRLGPGQGGNEDAEVLEARATYTVGSSRSLRGMSKHSSTTQQPGTGGITDLEDKRTAAKRLMYSQRSSLKGSAS